MKLRRVGNIVWEICAASDGADDYPALSFLVETRAHGRQAAARILQRMTGEYAERGPGQGANAKRLRNGIWEWKQGRLRVLWFHDRESGRAIATHGFMKKSQMAPVEEIEVAIAIRQQYLLDKAYGRIEFDDEENCS